MVGSTAVTSRLRSFGHTGRGRRAFWRHERSSVEDELPSEELSSSDDVDDEDDDDDSFSSFCFLDNNRLASSAACFFVFGGITDKATDPGNILSLG
jgi:hypothetical protein